jgi:succinate-semialdehyde dehydrogenase / glutarate-semialdehyde dehydrogenase
MSPSVASLTGTDVPAGLLIGGEWTGGRGGRQLPVIDPSTEDADIEAAVLGEVPPDAGILGTEIFGPVAPVVRFTAEDEVIGLANDTEYGLVSYLYSGDLRRALRVAEALGAGMVGVNRGIVSDPAAPFGGVKQSGIGREGGHEGLLEFCETKYVAVGW